MAANSDRMQDRWDRSRLVDLAPLIALLAGYGALRTGALVWGVVRDGLPDAVSGWTAFAAGTSAVGQAFAVVGLLAVPRLRRPVAAGVIGAAGLGAALLDAGVWAAIGDGGGPSRHVRDVVVAVGFAVFAALLCRSGVGWTRREGGGYDWARLDRVLRRVAGCGLLVAVAAGVPAVLVDAPGPVDRWVSLVAGLGVGVLVGAVLVLLPVIGEQRREAREAALAAIYRQIDEAQRRDER